MKELLDKLNPAQREAVLASDGPVLVIAGAGSGKTRVITYRIAYLIREMGVRPGQILAATFTNKAANEMKERVASILGYTTPPYMNIATFHALCARILRSEGYLLGLSPRFLIADDRETQMLMAEVLGELEIGKDVLHPKQALWMVGQLKMRMLPYAAAEELMEKHIAEVSDAFELGVTQRPQQPEQRDLGKLMVQVAELYQKRLREGDAVDFDDLILYVVQIFNEHPDILAAYQDRFRYLLVDEYQDTNMSQFKLVELLARRDKNICVVGDEDQAIYSWRGAELSNLLDFQTTYPGARLIKLEQNYRSTANVLAAASAVIGNNTERIGKTLWTNLGGGLPIGLYEAPSDLDEADRVAQLFERVRRMTKFSFRDMAVFYRVKSLSRTYEEAMRRYDIPYRVVGGTGFFERAEIRDLMAYLRLAVNPNTSIALLRIINTPRRGVGEKTLNDLMQNANRAGQSLFQAMTQAVESGELKGKAREALALLVKQAQGWMQKAANGKPSAVLQEILDDTGYEAALGDPKHIDVKGRIGHLQELRETLDRFQNAQPAATLGDWLEQVTLQSDQDEIEGDDDRVCLMTYHAAKGLEFPVVAMVGMEDPIFPNRRAADERGNIEEERRLFYVGITRAERLLVLMRADQRVSHGELRFNQPSPFLREVPESLFVPLHEIDLARIEDLDQKLDQRERKASKSAPPPLPLPKPGGSGASHIDKIMARFGSTTDLPSYRPPPPPAAKEPEVEPPADEGAPGELRLVLDDEAMGDFPAPSPAPQTPRRANPYARNSGAGRRLAPPRTGGGGSPGAPTTNPLPWVSLGSRVEHETLGRGLVVGLSGTGAQRKLLIEFDDGDQREMLAAYARLLPVV